MTTITRSETKWPIPPALWAPGSPATTSNVAAAQTFTRNVQLNLPSARVLVTGGAGFVGSHLVRHLLTNTDWHLTLVVTFRNHGNADRLRVAVEDHPDWQDRMTVMHHDLRGPFSYTQLHALEGIDAIINVASQSHVDRSISDPVPFVNDNVSLMLTMLEAARALKPTIFLHVSTDEVYGPAYDDDRHAEWSMIAPSNPYSASKAMQEAAAISWWRTYDVPVVITNTMNIIGETQDPEKFVPSIMRSLFAALPIVVHCDREGNPGSRFYLHARNQADALMTIVRHAVTSGPFDLFSEGARLPARYHVVGEREIDNIEMVELIAGYMGVKLMSGQLQRLDFHSSRPGHDLRYALDGSKILGELDWSPPIPLDQSLERTVKWTLEHPEWLG